MCSEEFRQELSAAAAEGIGATNISSTYCCPGTLKNAAELVSGGTRKLNGP